MDTFTLDLTGAVIIDGMPVTFWLGSHEGRRTVCLTPFARGSVIALLRGLSVDLLGEWLDRVDPFTVPGFRHLSPAALNRIVEDCARVADHLGGLTEEDGKRFWEHRAEGFPGPNSLDNWLREAFPPLRPTLSPEGRIELEEVS